MALKRALETEKRMAEESWITTEQLALIGFAARLGTSIANDAEISRDGDVREEAQLLMSLLSSKPPSQSLLGEEEIAGDSTESPSSPVNHTRDTFSFTCPSLSLHPSFSPQNEFSPARKYSDSDDSVPSLVSPATPAELLKRPLKVDDRNALRLSAEAMARNVLESFEEALQWRIQTWINSVAVALVIKEQALLHEEDKGDLENENSESKRTAVLEELVNSTEAKVITSLQHAAASIEIMDVKTSFRVLSERIVTTESMPPPKKRRLVKQPEYRVKHTISFQAVLNLLTPAGYTEVMLQTPGTIEGTFLPSLPEEETLTGVLVELDTSTLATTIERSSRIVVRSSAEACVKPPPSPTEQEAPQEQAVQEQQKEELVCMPTPTKSDIQYTDSVGQSAAVVTPRHPSPPSIYCDVQTMEKPIRFPLDDSDEDCRTVSPQPKTVDVASYLFTPRSTSINVPFLVTPSPTTKDKMIETKEGILTSSLPTLSPAHPTKKKRPSLPALVEVACAAMRAC